MRPRTGNVSPDDRRQSPAASAGLSRSSTHAAPPFLVATALCEGTGDFECPTLVDDREGLAPVADERAIGRFGGRAFPDLFGGRVEEAAVVDHLLPFAPGVGQGRIERKGSPEELERLGQKGTLALDGGWPPAHLGPHQAER